MFETRADPAINRPIMARRIVVNLLKAPLKCKTGAVFAGEFSVCYSLGTPFRLPDFVFAGPRQVR